MSEILGWLEEHVGAKRFKALETAFAKLEEEADELSFDFLTAKERAVVEDTIAQDRLEGVQSNGMNCVACYCVKRRRIELLFEGVIEDDGTCLDLKTPYDHRDGKFLDLADCEIDQW